LNSLPNLFNLILLSNNYKTYVNVTSFSDDSRSRPLIFRYYGENFVSIIHPYPSRGIRFSPSLLNLLSHPNNITQRGSHRVVSIPVSNMEFLA
jgi:hypothetical protein